MLLTTLKSKVTKGYCRIINRNRFTTVTCDGITIEGFCEHIKHLNECDINLSDFIDNTCSPNEFINDFFSEEEVKVQIKHLKNNKAGGCDLIFN